MASPFMSVFVYLYLFEFQMQEMHLHRTVTFERSQPTVFSECDKLVVRLLRLQNLQYITACEAMWRAFVGDVSPVVCKILFSYKFK